MPPVEIWLGIIKTQWIPIMVNIKIPGGPPLSSSLIRSIYCLPPSSNPYYGQYIICWWLLCSSSLFWSIYCLPPSINPCYGQYIIYWWLWCHFTPVFILCRPCYGQFIINWGLQRHFTATCVFIIPDIVNLSSLGDFYNNIWCILPPTSGKVMSQGVNKLQRPFLANSIYSRDPISKMSINSCENQINSCRH